MNQVVKRMVQRVGRRGEGGAGSARGIRQSGPAASAATANRSSISGNECGQAQQEGQVKDEVVRLCQWHLVVVRPSKTPPSLRLEKECDMNAPPWLAGLCSRILSFGRGGEMRTPFSQYSAS